MRSAMSLQKSLQWRTNFLGLSRAATRRGARTVTVFSLVLTLSGCLNYTWQDTVLETRELPQTLRITEQIEVRNNGRWLLSNNSRICLATVADVPATWVAAARNGLAQLIETTVVPDVACAALLYVDWPDLQGASPQKKLSGSLLGVSPWPMLPAAQQLRIRVLDRQQYQLTHLVVRMAPRWLDDPWHTSRHIEQAFIAVARSLVSGA